MMRCCRPMPVPRAGESDGRVSRIVGVRTPTEDHQDAGVDGAGANPAQRFDVGARREIWLDPVKNVEDPLLAGQHWLVRVWRGSGARFSTPLAGGSAAGSFA